MTTTRQTSTRSLLRSHLRRAHHQARHHARQLAPFAAIALLVPVVALPVAVLVPVATLALVVAGLVALADWAGRDSLTARRHPARREPDGVSGWAVAQGGAVDQPVSSRRR